MKSAVMSVLLVSLQAQAAAVKASDLEIYCRVKSCSPEFLQMAKKATSNNAEAENAIGEMFHFGHGVEQDYTRALAWYRKASDDGHATAPNHIGRLYLNGEGVDRNEKEACKWYKLSADRGDHAGVTNFRKCRQS